MSWNINFNLLHIVWFNHLKMFNFLWSFYGGSFYYSKLCNPKIMPNLHISFHGIPIYIICVGYQLPWSNQIEDLAGLISSLQRKCVWVKTGSLVKENTTCGLRYMPISKVWYYRPYQGSILSPKRWHLFRSFVSLTSNFPKCKLSLRARSNDNGTELHCETILFSKKLWD